MTSNENNWTLGEVANLPRMDKMLKDGTTAYMQFIASRYICIREATDGQRGILVKVLGKSYSDLIKTIDGKPFGFDDRAELFSCDSFYSYPFPSANEVHEVLDILRGNAPLLQKFEDAKMHVNPDGKFWVRETTRNAFLKKIPQVYDAPSGQLHSPSDDNYYRITMVYFFKGQLFW